MLTMLCASGLPSRRAVVFLTRRRRPEGPNMNPNPKQWKKPVRVCTHFLTFLVSPETHHRYTTAHPVKSYHLKCILGRPCSLSKYRTLFGLEMENSQSLNVFSLPVSDQPEEEKAADLSQKVTLITPPVCRHYSSYYLK